MLLIPARDFSIAPGNRVDVGPDGSLSSEAGNSGYVIYGPYVSLEGGVYRVEVDLHLRGDVEVDDHWEVYADERIFGAEPLSVDSTVIRVCETRRLEIRIHVSSASFTFRSVRLTPLILDREPMTPAKLAVVIAQAKGGGGDVATLFHLAARLGVIGASGRASTLRRDALESARERMRQHGGASVATAFSSAVEPEDVRPSALQSPPSAASKLRTFDAFVGFTPRQRRDLLDLGYRPETFVAMCHDRSDGEPSRSVQRAGRGGSLPGEGNYPDFIKRLYRHDLSFQTRVIKDASFSSYCPVTGDRVTSRHGFCQPMGDMPYLFYRLEGKEVFYICVGGWAGMKLFAYMPRNDLVVVLQDSWFAPGRDVLIAAFNQSIVAHSAAIDRYLNGPTLIAAVVGNNNLGHFLWNDLSGLQFALENNVIGMFDEVVRLTRDYVNPDELFPELQGKSNKEVLGLEEGFGYFLDRGLLPVRVTDLCIQDALADRLRKQAARHAKAHRPPAGKKGAPVLWINLRAHNKSWLQQVTGYANILNETLRLYGGVTAIVDGWTDCAEMAKEIRRLTDPRIKIYSGLEFGLWDSLNWAFACDAYVSTIGAGLTLVNWVAARPGVAHSEQSHMDQLQWWGYARPTATPPLAPPRSAIQDVGVGAYCNYNLDWRILFDLLTRALDPKLRSLEATSPPSLMRRLRPRLSLKRE